MKAIAAVSVFALSVSVAPVAIKRESWQAYRAYAYADHGHRLVARQQWASAAEAFSAAQARDPGNSSYAQMLRYASARLKPKPRILPQNPSPLVLASADHPAQSKTLIAIAPAVGSSQKLVADTKGRYWGALVRLTEAAPVLVAAEVREAPTVLLRAEPLMPTTPTPAKWLTFQTGMSYRPGAAAIASSEALLGRGGSWLDMAARLNGSAAHPLSLTGFLYSAQPAQRFGIESQSLQAGFGLRWQPHPAITVEAARLVKIGAQARNDWMLRAGAGVGQWRPANRAQTQWLHWQARADAALIGLERRDIFAQADARLGVGFRLSDTASITPYVSSTATLQKDTKTATLLEASPGLWLHLDGRLPLDARFEYRRKIAGSATSSNGVALTFGFAF
jgi:hypothetical protein